MSALTTAIEQARLGLAGAKRLDDLDESERAADALMAAIAQIGSILYGDEAGAGGSDHDVQLRGPEPSAELAAFVAETEESLYQAEPGVSGWLWSVRDRRPEDDGSYRRWLHDRSAIEFLRDIYLGTEGGEYADDLDTRGFDEEIRFRAEQFNVGIPPPGTPPHHWWWWLP